MLGTVTEVENSGKVSWNRVVFGKGTAIGIMSAAARFISSFLSSDKDALYFLPRSAAARFISSFFSSDKDALYFLARSAAASRLFAIRSASVVTRCADVGRCKHGAGASRSASVVTRCADVGGCKHGAGVGGLEELTLGHEAVSSLPKSNVNEDADDPFVCYNFFYVIVFMYIKFYQ